MITILGFVQEILFWPGVITYLLIVEQVQYWDIYQYRF